ncbi:MAG: hypothetical protein R3338_07085 [Thermoanaerobaculia bacterium]|nr:hypothetical protein [Thermoanaerobaculia bacterium]
MSSIEISTAETAPLEVELLGVVLTEDLRSKGHEVRGTGSDDPDRPGTLRIASGSNVAEIGSRKGVFTISSDHGDHEIPWFLPAPPVDSARTKAGYLRVGMAGGDDERRLRMTWKTLAELRKRRMSFTSIVVGTCNVPSTDSERPDELHEVVGPAELMMLLARLDVVLECTDGFDTESYLAVAARDAGIPVVAHLERADLTRAGNRLSERWSADGFSEALLEVTSKRVPIKDPSPVLSRILELIGAE